MRLNLFLFDKFISVITDYDSTGCGMWDKRDLKPLSGLADNSIQQALFNLRKGLNF